jgi:hypothetical protein
MFMDAFLGQKKIDETKAKQCRLLGRWRGRSDCMTGEMMMVILAMKRVESGQSGKRTGRAAEFARIRGAGQMER